MKKNRDIKMQLSPKLECSKNEIRKSSEKRNSNSDMKFEQNEIDC